MVFFITGCAGFIGYHLALELLDKNYKVISIDNINDYYDIKLKEARLKILNQYDNFHFFKADINDKDIVFRILSDNYDITHAVLLAAQSGVRYSMKNPFIYAQSNVNGLVVLLEKLRKLRNLKHIIFASSSSVYGDKAEVPFKTDSLTNQPSSFYAATKIAGEAICYSYSSIYKLPITVLRFFTVYGPWSRPDMAIYKFSKNILEGREIEVYNDGMMKRDFTHISDIIKGILSAIDKIEYVLKQNIPYKIYNLGSAISTELQKCIEYIENYSGKKANKIYKNIQSGDVQQTLADISTSRKELGFEPKIGIEEGISDFINWYKNTYQF